MLLSLKFFSAGHLLVRRPRCSLYSELLDESEHVEWLHWWKRSVVIVRFMNLLSSWLYPYSLARQDASYILFVDYNYICYCVKNS